MRSRRRALTRIWAGAAALEAMSPFTSASPMFPTPMKPSFFLVTMPPSLHPRRHGHRAGPVLPAERPIDRERAGTLDQHGDAQTESEQVVLETLALLHARPVHEEAHLRVDHERGGGHHAPDAERSEPGEESDQEQQRSAELRGQH